MRTRAGLLLLILCATLDVAAASAFTFVVESEGTYPAQRRGRIVADGTRWRLDLDAAQEEVRAYDSLIGGTKDRPIALNHSNKTWYHPDAALPTIPLHTLFDLYRAQQSRATKVRIEPGPNGVSFRYDAITRYEAPPEWKVPATSMRSEVSGTIALSQSDHAFPAFALLAPPSTSIADVDAKLRAALATLLTEKTGKSELTITRKLEGGRVMTQVIRVTVAFAGEVPGVEFEIPKGYRYQEPVYGAPGK